MGNTKLETSPESSTATCLEIGRCHPPATSWRQQNARAKQVSTDWRTDSNETVYPRGQGIEQGSRIAVSWVLLRPNVGGEGQTLDITDHPATDVLIYCMKFCKNKVNK